MLSGEAGIRDITQTDAGYKWGEAPCRGTGGALRDPGVEGRPDLGLGGGGHVAEGVTVHLTPEGWAGVSFVDGEGGTFAKGLRGQGPAALEELRRVHPACVG